MKVALPILNKLIQSAVILMTFFATAAVFAIDQPPQEPEQLRAWLVGHLVTDMEALGTFDGNTLAKVPGIVNALTDDQVALLAQYYYLTRSKTEQDASLYSLQQQGYAEDQVNEAKAPIDDLLTEMNDQTVACYDLFLTMPEPVQYLAQICYASVPGWCCHARCYVPEWYYNDGCFVGPCFNAAYAGGWAVPICNAYYNQGSHFYGRYHNVANTVYAKHSVKLAKRNANRLRNKGDWHNTLAHDRLLNRSSTVYRTTPTASTRNRIGNRPATGGSLQSARAEASRAHVGNYKPVVRQGKPKSQLSHAARPSRVRQQAAKARTTHASVKRPRSHQPAKHRTPHASVTHARASHAVAHASHPRQAAHAQAHASPGGHSRHR